MAATAVAAIKAEQPRGAKSSKAQHNRPQRLVAVPKPNDEEFRKVEETANGKITELQAVLTKLQEQIRSKQGGRDEFYQKKVEVRQRLDELNQKIEQLESERQGLLNRISEQQEQSRQKRNHVQTMKKGLQFETEEEIEEQLREMEQYMIKTSVSLQAEKEMVQKMQQLKKMKPLVRDYSQLDKESRATDSIVPLKGRLDILREELKVLRDNRRDESQRSQQLIEERNKSTAPVKDLLDQKTEIQGKIAEQRKVLLEIRGEKQKQQSRYASYLQELRKARRDAEKEEKRKQDLQNRKHKLERDIENLEMGAEVHPEMQLLMQTVAYVQRLVEEVNACGAAESSNPEETVVSPSSGVTLDAEFSKMLVPKSQRQEEFYYPPSNKKKGRKGKKGGAQKKQGVICHDLHTLTDFGELNIDPPLNYGDAEDCLAKLKEKLSTFEAKKVDFEQSNHRTREKLQGELNALLKEEKAQRKEEQEADEAAAAAAGGEAGELENAEE